MAKTGEVTVSAAQLRAMVNALADRFADQIEQTADQIGATTKDPAVRRRALAFKIDAVPAVYTAAYRADPLTSFVDVWALAFQLDQYLGDGAGRDSFGAGQGAARDSARELVAEADLAGRRAALPGAFDRARADVRAGRGATRCGTPSRHARRAPPSPPSGGPRAVTPSSPSARSPTPSRPSPSD